MCNPDGIDQVLVTEFWTNVDRNYDTAGPLLLLFLHRMISAELVGASPDGVLAMTVGSGSMQTGAEDGAKARIDGINPPVARAILGA